MRVVLAAFTLVWVASCSAAMITNSDGGIDASADTGADACGLPASFHCKACPDALYTNDQSEPCCGEDLAKGLRCAPDGLSCGVDGPDIGSSSPKVSFLCVNGVFVEITEQ